TVAASMAIGRPQAIDAAPLGAGAQRRMAGAGLSWLARNGRSPGEESLAAAIAARRSRFAVLWPDHAIKRPRGSRAGPPGKEKTWQTWVRTRGQASWAKEQNPWRTERVPSHPPDRAQRSHPVPGLSAADSGTVRSKRCRGPRCSLSDLTIGTRQLLNRR